MNTPLTRFKRIEQKYILTIAEKEELLELLKNEISPDDNGNADGKYGLESCYYDTENLDFYQEKIEKKEFRKKNSHSSLY